MIIIRMHQQHDHLAHQREQWIHMLLQGKPSQSIEQDGYRLGLPVEHGQLWVLAWPPETMTTTKAARQRMTAESVVLESLKSAPIFWGDSIAVVLLEEQASQSPANVRDALLKHCSVHPLWIVYGVRYHSLHDLKMALTNTIAIAHKARQEAYGEYLLDIYAFGLDSLLENPRLSADLEAFARKLLTPLIEYDTASGSHLTETFVLAQTLGSAQAVAEQLGVHINTIRYRLRHVKEILGTEQVSPKENAALTLAAFIWQHSHQVT
jgi:sugar diacid utilization regulator